MDFSVKTGTVMQGSNLPLSKWALVAFLMTTKLKGVSGMKLHRDMGITQKAAWHLAHRIRKAWETDKGLFTGRSRWTRLTLAGRNGISMPTKSAEQDGGR